MLRSRNGEEGTNHGAILDGKSIELADERNERRKETTIIQRFL